MKVRDIIYGEFEITEAVLIELLNSKPVQRLKGIAQYGVPSEFYIFPGFTRFDHSLGVMLLLRKLNASVEEQAAGLLHDVSHTAFSHVVDWVIGDRVKEDFQDNNFEKIINESEIPEILKNNGLELSKITNLHNYTLIEREIPDLCADRVDYSLREFFLWGNPQIVENCLLSLIDYEGNMIFSSKVAAKDFAENYLKLQVEHWASVDTTLRYHIFAEVLKIAMNNKIVQFEDFFKDDLFIMNKIRKSGESKINDLIKKLSQGEIKYKFAEKDYDIELKKKFRHVDPEFEEGGRIFRLSDVDLEFKKYLEDQRKINEKGYKVKY